MKPPRLIGRALTAARIAAETQGTSLALLSAMKRSLGIHQLALLPETFRGGLPSHHRPIQAAAPRRWGNAELGSLPIGDWPRSSSAYTALFRDRVTTPRRIAERALSEIAGLSEQKP